jgi:hypothetical protein
VPTSPYGLGLFHLVAIAEGARLFREVEDNYQGDADTTGIYPGFDPLGLATGSDSEIKQWREKVPFTPLLPGWQKPMGFYLLDCQQDSSLILWS